MVIEGVFYLHHTTNPEAAIDGIDTNNSLGGLLDNSIQKPNMVCNHDREPWRN